jgi:hypothetical protein
MAWNKHAFNVGTWASFVPGHTGPTRYAEALLWGPPMYMYFGVALATIQYWTFRATCKLGKVLALLLAFVVAFVFDLVVESAIIQTTHAYSWSFTIGALSMWEGTQYQFPLYEALLVAIYGSLYSWLDASARSSDGVSFIERGVQYVPLKLQLLTRFFAATGFAALCTAIYFGGFYAFSQFADSRAELPSYLMPSDEGVHSFR